jgi:hypothetical protein
MSQGKNQMMKNAEDQFAKRLERLFSQLPLIPDVEIAGVHSADYCEDGKTFHLMLDTVDRRTLVVAATPGEPLRVGFVD